MDNIDSQKYLLCMMMAQLKARLAQLRTEVTPILSQNALFILQQLQISDNEQLLKQPLHQGQLSSQVHLIITANNNCIDSLVQQLQRQSLIAKSTSQPISDENLKQQQSIRLSDYQSLEEAVQRAEQENRKHIAIQHQMKICLEELEEELSSSIRENSTLANQLKFVKKQLALAKKNELSHLDKLNKALETISAIQKTSVKNNKPTLSTLNNLKKSKIHTQPQQTFSFYNKNFNHKQIPIQAQINLNHENLLCNYQEQSKFNNGPSYQFTVNNLETRHHSSKLGPKKYSKIALNNQEIIALSSFTTLNLQNKTYEQQNSDPFKNSHENTTKQIFWNKRLKKKQSTTAEGIYTDIMTGDGLKKKSLNISPRQLKKKKSKEKQLKDAYAINLRSGFKRGINLGSNNKAGSLMNSMKKKLKSKQRSVQRLVESNQKPQEDKLFKSLMKQDENKYVINNRSALRYKQDRSRSVAY